MMVKFRLRRVNASADVSDKQSQILSTDFMQIGRHSQSDMCLISATNPCLISRHHAEIRRYQQTTPDGIVPLHTLTDTSLNGTYVNNRRIAGSEMLTDGDIVTFGYLGGHVIKAGQLAPKHQLAEFQFIFEAVSDDTIHCDDNTADTIDSDEESRCVIAESINAARNFQPSDSESLSQSQTVTPQPITIVPDGLRPALTALCLPSLHTTLAGTSSHLATNNDRSGDCSNNNTETLDQQQTKQFIGTVKQEPDVVLKRYSDITNADVLRSPLFDINLPTASRSLQGHQRSSGGHRGSAQGQDNCSTSMSADCDARLRDVQGQTMSVIDEKNTSKCDKELKKSAKRKISKNKPQQEQKQRNRQSQGVKRKNSETGNTVARKRRRRRSSSDGTLHQASNDTYDTCAAIDCQKPQTTKVSWVQCDDCDSWYHTVCVGCTSDLNKLQQLQFHCGCV